MAAGGLRLTWSGLWGRWSGMDLWGAAAPIQVSYLGYCATTGAPYVDYFVSDRIISPPHTRADFSESLVYLPHVYQVPRFLAHLDTHARTHNVHTQKQKTVARVTEAGGGHRSTIIAKRTLPMPRKHTA